MGSNHKHTPGPWLFDANPGGYAIYSPIKDGKTYRICSIGPVDCVQTEERNARLLCAAPELLAELGALLGTLEGDLANGAPLSRAVTVHMARAAAAIAKATQ